MWLQLVTEIQEAAIRDWVSFGAAVERNLIRFFCLCYLMQHASFLDGCVQVRRTKQGMKVQQLEWAAESNETLHMASIGGTKALLEVGSTLYTLFLSTCQFQILHASSIIFYFAVA